jgi:glycosyltransferase involved in cell wall biosynthesis
MEKAITISVTVPVHNTAPYLPKCLDSLLAQTYPHLEIICVDDGSTDNSLQILNDYAARDSRIKVFHQEAQGVSAARNTALLHSSGDFVTSLDSDDYIAPDTYEKAVACIADDVDWVSYGIELVDTDGNPLPDHDGYYATTYKGTCTFTPEMAHNMNVCIWAKLWRRSIMADHGMQYPVGLVHEDDAIFYMFAPYVRKAAFIQDTCYYYVQRRGSIMHDNRKSIADAGQYLGILRYVFDFYQRNGLNPLHNPYILAQFERAYYLVERFCPPHQRSQLAEMFRTLAQETGLAAAHPHDWRLRCLNLPGRFLSHFIRRRSRSTQYRLGPVPLFSLHYTPDSAAPALQLDLVYAMRNLFCRIICRRQQRA